MPLKFTHLPKLALFSLSTLLGLVLATSVILPTANERIHAAQNDYGQTLASTTARRVMDAFFNNELVRMQGALQSLASQPHIVQATIHDVENNLLVQAGELRPDQQSHSSYSASIVIHDSVAGYMTITLRKFNQPLGESLNVIWIASILLCVLCGFSLYQSKAVIWVARQKPEPDQAKTENEEEHSDTRETPESPENLEVVYAVIHIKNQEVLKQQLTNDTFSASFARFEKIVGDVLALYSGTEIETRENYYILKFPAGDAQNEAIFRASCSAFLIAELASIINKVPLDLAAFISANEEDLVPAKLPVAGLVMESQAAQDELIRKRLRFMEVGTEDGRSIISNFEQPFSGLLEKQRKQLNSMLNQT